MPITGPPPPVKAAPPKTAVRHTAVTQARCDALTGFGQLAQVPLMAIRQYADVGTLAAHWPGVAAEIAKLADSQPQIAKLIDPLIQVGPYTGLIAALLPFVMQVGVNHKLLAPGAMGTLPAATISAQVEGALARQELDALRTQYEAEKTSRELKAEMQAERDKFIAESNYQG